MTAIERIQALIEYMGMNAKTFSEYCGYERPQVFYDIFKGKTRNISASMCNRIIAALPEVSREWLMTGDGTMITKNIEAAKNEKQTVDTVPLLPTSAFAGPISAYYQEGIERSRCERIATPNKLAELALPVTGDSMEPLIADGSVVFIKRINEASFIPWGHTLVLETENGVFIKNVLPDNDDQSYIWAESLNPKYPPMHIPKRAIGGMYRVLFVQKSFMTM